jgi:hypothetical protein
MPVRSLSGEKPFLLSLFRGSAKVSNMFRNMLSVKRLSERMEGMGYVTPTGVYGEEAFRHILESESERSRRSGHSYQILLVSCANAQGTIVPMEPAIAKRLIAALSRNLRDTDYIGWYREGCVLGGVLTVFGPNSDADVSSRLRPRLVEILRDVLGIEESRRFQIQVCQPHELEEVDSVSSSFNTASCGVFGRVLVPPPCGVQRCCSTRLSATSRRSWTVIRRAYPK